MAALLLFAGNSFAGSLATGLKITIGSIDFSMKNIK
jgi:hypothetical protein